MAEERERFLGELDLTLRRRYLNIFKGHGYTTLATVSLSACSGCGQRQTPQRALDIRENGDLGACQGCGRLLIGVEL
jgi:predicted  nucleic acid-binding Zn-ribbon protein